MSGQGALLRLVMGSFALVAVGACSSNTVVTAQPEEDAGALPDYDAGDPDASAPRDFDLNPYGVRYPTTDLGVRPRDGVQRGERIANLRLRAFAAGQGATAQDESLARFYDPEGRTHDVIIAVGFGHVFSPCTMQVDAFAQAPQRSAVLFFHTADKGQKPAEDDAVWTFASMRQKTWAWNVVDPRDELGRYFYLSACPVRVVIDARTMEILVAANGYSAEFPAQAELLRQQLLARPPSY